MATNSSSRKTYSITAQDNTKINYVIEEQYASTGALASQRIVEIKDELGVSYSSLTEANNAHAAVTEVESIIAEKTSVEKQTQSNLTGNKATSESLPQSALEPIYSECGNILYNEVKVFLEGVQVPQANCSVSYGISSPPTATITIPAARFIRFLPETTKVLIVYRDLLMSPAKTESIIQATESKQGKENSDGSKNGNAVTSAANAATSINSNSTTTSSITNATAASTNPKTGEAIKKPITDVNIDTKRGVDNKSDINYSECNSSLVKERRYYYRVLFDGELSGLQYSINPEGAMVTLQAIHSVAYISLMQLTTQPAVDTVFFRANTAIGDLVLPSVGGQTVVESTLIKNILESGSIKSMADIAYMLIKNMTQGYPQSPVATWYGKVLGNEEGGYKILNRIYGVSNVAKEASLVKCEYASLNKDKTKETIVHNASYKSGEGYFEKAAIDAKNAGLRFDEITGRGVVHGVSSVSGFFKIENMMCKCGRNDYGDNAEVKELAVDILDRINTAVALMQKDTTLWKVIGDSLQITSGIRCSHHEISIRRAKQKLKASAHTGGRAIDLSISNPTPTILANIADVIVRAKVFDRVVIERFGDMQWIHCDYGHDKSGKHSVSNPIVSWGAGEQSSLLGSMGVEYGTLYNDLGKGKDANKQGLTAWVSANVK